MSITRSSLLACASLAMCASGSFAQSIPNPTSPSSADTTGATTSHDVQSGRTSASHDGAAGGVSDKDANFMKEAASIGMMEVEAGKLAKDQASSPKVKEFADAMVQDHGKNNDELKQVAEAKGVTLPTSPEGKPKMDLDSLKSKSGADFDKAYAAANVKGHQDAIAKFQKAAKSSDAEVKAFAEKTLPTLKHHLEMAKSMQTAVAGKRSERAHV